MPEAQWLVRPAGGAWSPAPDGGRVLAIDSWRTVDHAVIGVELHAARFATACRRVAGLDWATTADFVRAAASGVPATGDWFPRAELVGRSAGVTLRLRIRPTPPRAPSATVWIAGASRARRPRVKGADLDYLSGCRADARSNGADEAILLDGCGRVLEGASSSVVWWTGPTLCVVDSAATLDGITQRLLVELATKLNVEVRAARIRPDELAGRPVWLLNALHGIRPVTGRIGPAEVSAAPALVTAWRELLEALRHPVGGPPGDSGRRAAADVPGAGTP